MPDLLRLPGCTVDLTDGLVHIDDTTRSLTPLETRVVRFLGDRRGDIVSREELEAQVWGFAPGVRSEVVPVAMRRLRGTLERDPKQPQALITERGRGWRLVVEEGPDRRSTLWGRDVLLAELEAGWDQHWLQTLTGPGGIGKSAVAAEALPGATVVALEAATTEAELGEALRAALGLPALEGSLDDVVAHVLRGGTSLLFDDAHGVVDVLRRVLGRIPTRAARVVVTARRPLGLPHERVVHVGPLDDDGSVALFRHHYDRAGGRAPLDDDALRSMIALLGGHPLAIALTAPLARVQPLDRLHQRLVARGLGVVEDRHRSDRHASLTACLASTHEAVQPDARAVLDGLAALPGGLSFDEVERLVDADPFDALEALIDAGLVHRVAERYRVAHLVRRWLSETRALPRAAAVPLVLDRVEASRRGPRPFAAIAHQLSELRAVADHVGPDHAPAFLRALGDARRGGAHLPAVLACVGALPALDTLPDGRLEQALIFADQLRLSEARVIADDLRLDELSAPFGLLDLRRRLALRGHGAAPDLDAYERWSPETPADWLDLGGAQLDAGAIDAALDTLRRAEVSAEEDGDSYVLVRTLALRHIVLDNHRTPDDGQLLRRALDLAEEAGLVHQALHVRALLVLHRGGADRHRQEAELAELEADLLAIGKTANAGKCAARPVGRDRLREPRRAARAHGAVGHVGLAPRQARRRDGARARGRTEPGWDGAGGACAGEAAAGDGGELPAGGAG
jgi:hypothetical protein